MLRSLYTQNQGLSTAMLNINENLLQEALALEKETDINLVVESALREFIERRKRLKILELFGSIDYDEDYDYKKQRQQG
jgi:hypothetical protein